MGYRYILFDLDGTITESDPGILRSVRYALEKMEIEIPEEAVLRKFIGPPLADSMQRYCGMNAEEAVRAIGYYREYYTRKGIFENSVYAGLPDAMRRLRAAGKVAVVATSKPEDFARQIAEHFGFDSLFDGIYGASMDETRVEKEEVVAYALTDLGITRERLGEALMVGDRRFDVEGARANGLDCMGVLYGYGSRRELEEAGARYIVATPEEIAEKILELDP